MKGINMYTIKSVSDDGIYYLVNGWHKVYKMWVHENEIKQKYLFKSIAGAKNSLTKLLKIMWEYKTDKFSVVKIDENNKIIAELNI